MIKTSDQLDGLTDEELVRLAQSKLIGDTRAFRSLLMRHQGKVAANCRYMTRSQEDVDDLVQEVFVKAYFALGRFRGDAQFWTWLKRIKINHCLTFIKSNKSSFVVDIDSTAEDREEFRVDPKVDQDFKSVTKRKLVRATLESLPEKLRVALVLCDLDGLTYEEVSETLGISLSAARMRIKRGRDEFKKRYDLARSRTTMSPMEEVSQ